MKFVTSLFCGCLMLAYCQQVFSKEWLITSVNVLDIHSGQYSEPQNVWIKEQKIQGIGKNVGSESATKIDGTGKYLVPGFTEMHAHVPPSTISDEERDRLLFLYSAYGITTIRGMLGHPWHLTLREQLNRNQVSGPRLITSGPSFNGRSVTSAKMAIGKTKTQKQKGYDFIKVHPGMSAQSYSAMANQANKMGLPFGGHVTAAVGIVSSAALGQGTVDHLDGVLAELAKRSGAQETSDTGFFGSALVDDIDESHIPALAKQLAHTGIAMVPTESLMYGFVSPEPAEQSAQADALKLMPERTVNQWIATRKDIHNSDGYSVPKAKRFFKLREMFIKAFVDAGGLLLLGSDAPQVFNVPGDAIHVEMSLMVQAGMSPLQVLQSASLLPAKFFGQEKEFGAIKTGLVADLVLLDKDPLADIRHTREIAGVMTRGQWLDAFQIKQGLNKISR